MSSKLSVAGIGAVMHDERKVEDVVLALLHLNAFKDRYGWRAWKGFDWDAPTVSMSVG